MSKGAICDDCGKDMLSAKGCDHGYFLHPDGTIYERNKVDTGGDFGVDNHGRCFDCGAKAGTYHHSGCDTERCPRCGGQALGCRCTDDYLPPALKLSGNTENVNAKWNLPKTPGKTGLRENVSKVCAHLRQRHYRPKEAEICAAIEGKGAPFSCGNLRAMTILFDNPDPKVFIRIVRAAGKP